MNMATILRRLGFDSYFDELGLIDEIQKMNLLFNEEVRGTFKCCDNLGTNFWCIISNETICMVGDNGRILSKISSIVKSDFKIDNLDVDSLILRNREIIQIRLKNSNDKESIVFYDKKLLSDIEPTDFISMMQEYIR